MQEADFGGQSVPVGGFAYYISPPSSAGAPGPRSNQAPGGPRSFVRHGGAQVSNIWEDPLHAPWQKAESLVLQKLLSHAFCLWEEACFGVFSRSGLSSSA